MDGLHHSIDDQAHILFRDILAVDFLDEPHAVHGIKVVALEHHDDSTLGIHQVHVLCVVLLLHGISAHVGQRVHDGLLAGDVVAGFATADEVAELEVVAAQLEGAVDGVAAVVAIHLIAALEVQVQVSALQTIDFFLAHGDDVPFSIELLGRIGDGHVLHGLLHGVDILDADDALLHFLVLLLAGIHRGGSHQHGQQESKNDISFHVDDVL